MPRNSRRTASIRPPRRVSPAPATARQNDKRKHSPCAAVGHPRPTIADRGRLPLASMGKTADAGSAASILRNARPPSRFDASARGRDRSAGARSSSFSRRHACLFAPAQYAFRLGRGRRRAHRDRTSSVRRRPHREDVMISIDRNCSSAVAALSLGVLLATGGSAMAGSLGGPLELAGRRQLLRQRPDHDVEPSRHVGLQRAAARHHHRQPDVRAIPHPEDRQRTGDRHGARLRPHRRHLRDHAGRTRGLGDLFRAQGLPGLCRRPFRPRALRLRSDRDQPRPRAKPTPPRCPTSRSRRASAPGTSSASARPIRRRSRARSFRSRRSTNTPRSSCPMPRRRCRAPAPTPCRRSARCSTRSGPRS